MTRFQFLLDENVDHDLRTGLHQHIPEIVVWAIGDRHAPAQGTLDPELLAWCEAHGFILVTNNRRTMPGHLGTHLAAGHHVPGIFILNPTMSLGETVDELLLIWSAADPEEYRDSVRYLPVSR